LALLRAEAKDAAAATAFLHAAAAEAAALPQAQGVMVFPPVPPPIARVAGIERMQMLLESRSRGALQRMLAARLPTLMPLAKQKAHRVLRWAVDVDPLAI
jgi:primosomal protein N' (replication factor Y)